MYALTTLLLGEPFYQTFGGKKNKMADSPAPEVRSSIEEAGRHKQQPTCLSIILLFSHVGAMLASLSGWDVAAQQQDAA